MISMTETQTPFIASRTPLPKTAELSQQADMVEAAQSFTEVFLADYVNFMLEEVEQDDDEFSTQAFNGVFAQALADQVARSPAGQSITNTVLAELTRLQAVQGGPQS